MPRDKEGRREKKNEDRYEIVVSLGVRRINKSGQSVDVTDQGFFESSMTWKNAKYPAVVAVEAMLGKAAENMVGMGFEEMGAQGFQKEVAQLVKLLSK